jgi:prevent-host-death family protein
MLSVAEAKRRLSELMSRAAYRGERFLIRRRNVPMVALVPVGDLSKLEQALPPGRGLLAAVGAWAEFDNLDKTIAEIYRQRRRAKDRRVRSKS